MKQKTRDLINRIRVSRAEPKFDATYFDALAADVVAMGREAFTNEVKSLFKGPKPASRSRTADPHPLTDEFQKAHLRSYHQARRGFIDEIVSLAVSEQGDSFKLKVKDRTMPRMLAAYSSMMSQAALKELMNKAADRSAR